MADTVAHEQSPLARWRELKGWSQNDLAKKFGFKGTGTISKWESGQVPAERVIELSKITGLPPHRFRPDLYPEDMGRA